MVATTVGMPAPHTHTIRGFGYYSEIACLVAPVEVEGGEGVIVGSIVSKAVWVSQLV